MNRTIQMVALSELLRAPRNPKGHAVDDIRRSMARHGVVELITVDERTGRIIAGHGRLEPLMAKRSAGEAPPEGVEAGDADWKVPVVRGWASASDSDAEAYLLLSNRLTELGGWDDAGLAEILKDLAAEPEGLLGTGYNDSDLDALLEALAGLETPGGLNDADEVPDQPAEPHSKPGDIWQLGPHRVICGDCTDEQVVRCLLGNDKPNLLVTDPPYGVAIGVKNRTLNAFDKSGRVLTDLKGDQGVHEVEELWRGAFKLVFDVLPPGCPYYIFGPQGGELGLLLLLLRDSGLEPRHVLIWAKNRASFSLGRLDYDYQHEPIVYGWRPGGPHPWHASESKASILEFDRPSASALHPTMKPVALLEELITNSTPKGGVILDLFAGSGSTGIACHATGRTARLVEIEPGYVDVVCRRYQEHTGELPILQETGNVHDFT